MYSYQWRSHKIAETVLFHAHSFHPKVIIIDILVNWICVVYVVSNLHAVTNRIAWTRIDFDHTICKGYRDRWWTLLWPTGLERMNIDNRIIYSHPDHVQRNQGVLHPKCVLPWLIEVEQHSCSFGKYGSFHQSFHPLLSSCCYFKIITCSLDTSLHKVWIELVGRLSIDDTSLSNVKIRSCLSALLTALFDSVCTTSNKDEWGYKYCDTQHVLKIFSTRGSQRHGILWLRTIKCLFYLCSWRWLSHKTSLFFWIIKHRLECFLHIYRCLASFEENNTTTLSSWNELWQHIS